jgi:two-component system response regulator YesN
VAAFRLNKAKELLRDTKISVAEVCKAVGYADVKRFARAFRKAAGVGPREFRKLYS